MVFESVLVSVLTLFLKRRDEPSSHCKSITIPPSVPETPWNEKEAQEEVHERAKSVYTDTGARISLDIADAGYADLCS